MSRVSYLDQDTRDQAEEAKRHGTPVAVIAQRLGMSPDNLCDLMGWPQWREIPPAGELNIFAVERLESLL